MYSHISVLVSKELTEGFRSYRFLIWAIICGFFGILSPLSAYYMPNILALIGSAQNVLLPITEVTYRDAVGQYFKNFTQIGSIVMIFLTMGSVAGEKADGSMQFLVVRPITYRSILCSKVLALVFMVVSGTCIATILSCLYSRYFFLGFPLIPFIQSNMILILYLLVIGVITTSLSAMVQKPIAAGLGSLGLWLVFSIFGSLGNAGRYSFTKMGSEMVHFVEGFPLTWEPFATSILIMIGSISGVLQVIGRRKPLH